MTFILNFQRVILQGYTYLKLSTKLKIMTEANPSLSSRKTLPLILMGLGLILISSAVYFIARETSPGTDFLTVPVKMNSPAPELQLSDTLGVSHSLVDYRGQVLLVNLWATWCHPCKEEMPTLQAFYDQFKNKGFVVIAINDGDPTSDVLQFVTDYELTFEVWLDPTYIATEQAFKTLNLPTSYVIDRSGTIQLMWVGGISRRMLDKHVTPLIMETQ